MRIVQNQYLQGPTPNADRAKIKPKQSPQGGPVATNEEEKFYARRDSFVLETNVHFPTDLNLLCDAVRKAIE